MGSVRIGDELCKCDQRVIDAFDGRIRELESERDIFARTLDKRDAECAEQHRVIDARNIRIRELEAENKGLREALVLIRGWREIDRASPWEVLEEIERMVSKALGDTDGQ